MPTGDAASVVEYETYNETGMRPVLIFAFVSILTTCVMYDDYALVCLVLPFPSPWQCQSVDAIFKGK